MSQRSLTMAFVMDPIESVSIEADTTFVLMLEAQRRGHEVLYVDPADLAIDAGRPVATVTPVVLQREQGRHVEKGEPRQVVLDEAVDLAFQRVDPPVDRDYIVATQILALCERTLVLNRPQSVLAANEKLYALEFRQFMAETIVTRKPSDLKRFLSAQGGEMIVKPLDGKGGEGIFHVVAADPNVTSIIELATEFGTRSCMAQRYIPEIRQGDKRILLLEGEPIGAVLRVPSQGESRANFHSGGRAVEAKIDERDHRILAALSPALRRDGFFFVGIDVIGGCLTEVNVTSPTGVQEINALDGVCLEAQVIDAAEQAVERHCVSRDLATPLPK